MVDDVRPDALLLRRKLTRDDASTQLSRDARAPGLARQLVRRLCAEAAVGGDASETAILLTSEAVTNSVLHGRGQVRLRARVGDGRVSVEVADHSRRSPVTAPADAGRENGRGIRLLQEFASAWGVDVRGRGKTVWFEVATA